MSPTWQGEIVGHRGAAGLAPENTLESFEAAVSAGADRVELDTRLTRDDHLVVFHDYGFDRLGPPGPAETPRPPVSRSSLRDLLRIDVGARLGHPGAFIPSLEQVIELLRGRVLLNVEVKGSGPYGLRVLDACVAILGDHGVLADTVVSSFHPRVVERAADTKPGLARALICTKKTEGAPVAAAQAVRATDVHVHRTLVDAELVTTARRAGIPLRAWTVNELDEMRRFADLGLDGIVTDRPDLLRDMVGR